MKKISRALHVGLVIVLCGCAAEVSRHGYVLDPSQVGISCDVPIKRDFHFSDQEIHVLGNIEIHDKFMPNQCDEGAVFKTVIADACALNADVINVVGEKQPDYVWTSCYGVNAQFLRFVDREQTISIESDPHYEMSAIQQRAAISKQRASAASATAIAIGVVAGVIAGSMAGSAAGSK